MSRLFGPVFQLAYVVEALDPMVSHMTRTLGIGPFFLFPTPVQFAWLELDGVRTDRRDVLAAAALAYSGDTMVELIVPGPDPSPYRRFLDEGRRGLHHIGTIATDYDAEMAAARAAGIGVAMEGELPLSRFAYLETDTAFPGTMLEIIDMRPAMRELFGAIRAASLGWDGSDPVRAL
jgi:hypothetical protein